MCGKWAPTQMTADHDRHKCLISIRCDMYYCFYFASAIAFAFSLDVFRFHDIIIILRRCTLYRELYIAQQTVFLHSVYVSNNHWDKHLQR